MNKYIITLARIHTLSIILNKFSWNTLNTIKLCAITTSKACFMTIKAYIRIRIAIKSPLTLSYTSCVNL